MGFKGGASIASGLFLASAWEGSEFYSWMLSFSRTFLES
jgi:hypothetical protein